MLRDKRIKRPTWMMDDGGIAPGYEPEPENSTPPDASASRSPVPSDYADKLKKLHELYRSSPQATPQTAPSQKPLPPVQMAADGRKPVYRVRRAI